MFTKGSSLWSVIYMGYPSAQNFEAENRKNPPKSRFPAKKPQKQYKFNRKSLLRDDIKISGKFPIFTM